MARFVVSYFSEKDGLVQQVVEGDTRDQAVRFYFDTWVNDYFKNDEGFIYFKEDFFDSIRPLGAITEL